MQELSDTLESYAKDLERADSNEETVTVLRKAAVKWSEFALLTYEGLLLEKALSISAALASFENERERTCRT